MKLAILGCGLRTPLLLHGLAHSDLPLTQVALYDIDSRRAALMLAMGIEIAGSRPMGLSAPAGLEATIAGSDFVISSIRVGGLAARARDERISVEHGFAGQETTGPAGFAMALRNLPVSLEHARLVQRLAPAAWIVNFTNPAGLITQAIATHVTARVVGICDTPAELFYRISLLLERPVSELDFEYLGLNHLGWVSAVHDGRRDVTESAFASDLSRLYPAAMFSPELIRTMRLIPTEYLFFYYSQRRALENQLKVGATRGEEILAMNATLSQDLEAAFSGGQPEAAVQIYKRYLNRRNASYLKLEGSGESAFQDRDYDWDPFLGETGYHRIAIDALRALSGLAPRRIVLNVANGGAAPDLRPDDVIETPCQVTSSAAVPVSEVRFPEAAKGLVIAVKQYERATIRAALERSGAAAGLALFLNPIVADWDQAQVLAAKFSGSDPFSESQPVSKRTGIDSAAIS
jgi:6-phospho-beta-glucosidase